MLKKQAYVVIAISYTMLLIVACLMPVPESNRPTILYLDKIVHFGVYFIATFLWFLTFYKTKHTASFGKAIMKTIVVTLSLGVSIEFAQEYLTNHRYFEWLDILANSLGILVATALLYGANKYKLLKLSK